MSGRVPCESPAYAAPICTVTISMPASYQKYEAYTFLAKSIACSAIAGPSSKSANHWLPVVAAPTKAVQQPQLHVF